ncbi:MAG: monovalent cation/H(+) antiporter subunit G [Verrucomicrobiota bacterium]
MIWLLSLLLVIGSSFALIASIGLIKMPDLYTRMHAATKAGAFGGGIILLTCALASPNYWVWLKVVVIILFFFMTAPIAAHMVGRAAYLNKIPFSKRTIIDHLEGKYSTRKSGAKSHKEAKTSEN